ncbi:MAG: hypothetical protein Q4D24_14325 [Erysipelotrichaceae bacterium]|nr:hypothetical protein [Erysipelotrichaceae bacterium]
MNKAETGAESPRKYKAFISYRHKPLDKEAVSDIVQLSKAREKEIMIDKAESLIRVMFTNLNFNTTEFHRICSLIIDTQNVENDQQLAGLAYKQLTANAATRPKPKKTKAENINFTIE